MRATNSPAWFLSVKLPETSRGPFVRRQSRILPVGMHPRPRIFLKDARCTMNAFLSVKAARHVIQNRDVLARVLSHLTHRGDPN